MSVLDLTPSLLCSHGVPSPHFSFVSLGPILRPLPLEHLMLGTGWFTGAIFQKTDNSQGRKETVAAMVKSLPAQAGDLRHGQRSLVTYSP